VWLLAALLCVVSALVLPHLRSHADREDLRPRGPNVVVIQTDDQTAASLNRRTMPNVHRLLVERGVTFTSHIVASPLCCPSRASLLTGQYPHNHGIRTNTAGYAALRQKENTLPSWLRRAGYRTAHLGKFLNNYDRFAAEPATPAPGWDEWSTMIPPYGYFGFELGVNGERRAYGSGRADYLTTVLNRRATRFIRDSDRWNRPLLLALDQFAPHGQSRSERGSCGRSAVPLPGDFRRFARERLPGTPAFAEADLSDKPRFRWNHTLSKRRIEAIRANYRCRLATLRAVDRGVKRIVKALRHTGELERTVIVFTSDNGFLHGEHGIPAQKAQAYEEAIRVPLVVRTPRTAATGSRIVDAPTSNVDLAPTIIDLAGASPCRAPGRCRTLDGRSLVPFLEGREPDWADGRGLLTTFTNGHSRNAPTESCRFSAVRTREFAYVEYRALPDPATLECGRAFARELYDLREDPFQLDNRIERANLAEDRDRLARRLERLERCAGIRGRDERKAGRPFCE
jgi:N-acetylglucosamine-6-sulfatase